MAVNYQVIDERPVRVWLETALLDTRLDAEFYQPIYLRTVQAILSTGFPHRALVELCEKKARVYWGIKGLEASPSETHIPYIRPNEVDDDGWVDYGDLTTVERHWASELPDAVAKPGDLLVEVKGNARKVHVVRTDVPPDTFVSGSMFRFVLDGKLVNSYYVWAYLSSATCQTLKERLMSNSIIKWINPDDMCNLPVPLPPRPVQDHIGAKVRLAERCRLRARELDERVQARLDGAYAGVPVPAGFESKYWVSPNDLDSPRIDAWHYQPAYQRLTRWCQDQHFVPVASVTSLSRKTWSPSQASTATFHYVEISDVNISNGSVRSKELRVGDAPGRARKLAEPYDVLVSTVRPERKGVGIIGPETDGWVVSTGFGVLKARSAKQALYVCAALRRDASTIQLMRWNTGAAYPAIEEDVPLLVLIPDLDLEQRNEIADEFALSLHLLTKAARLIAEAKSDAEALIEGRLDVDGILAGRVKPPTWDEVGV